MAKSPVCKNSQNSSRIVIASPSRNKPNQSGNENDDDRGLSEHRDDDKRKHAKRDA